MLKEAILDLEEAEKILPLAERATYLLAYNAMLKAGRALLLLQGFVPDDGAQHKTVVEVMSAIMGERYRHLTEQFESMRRKRHEMTYEAGTLLSKSEVEKAFSDAVAIVKKILKEVKDQNPQLELKFELRKKR
ncbi:MAG: HEPN domain-containing protein [Desulfobacterota bacterium]|nr:HEPN domain-containing protein [Thermodesulfobacteriota bacterium]